MKQDIIYKLKPYKDKFVLAGFAILIPISYLYLMFNGYLDWYTNMASSLFADVISNHANNYIKHNDLSELFLGLLFQMLYVFVIFIPYFVVSIMFMVLYKKLASKRRIQKLIVKTGCLENYKFITQQIKNHKSINIIIEGGSGYGKTELVKILSKRNMIIYDEINEIHNMPTLYSFISELNGEKPLIATCQNIQNTILNKIDFESLKNPTLHIILEYPKFITIVKKIDGE